MIDPISAELLLASLAVAAPFLGALAVVAVYLGWESSRASAWLAVAFTGISTVLVGWLWWVEAKLVWRVDWIEPLGIGFGWRLEPFTMLFAVMVATFALLTMLYSAAYLPRMLAAYNLQWNPALYYAALLFFTGAMLGLVWSEDLFQFYIFWEMLDLASFVLIGLAWRNLENRRAAFKALLITALGGLALLFGFILLFISTGTSSISELLEAGVAAAIPADSLVIILLLIAAASKSAQFPLHVWLPPAMVAPTPVNAFLDSAALVAAGVFLVVRFNPLFAESSLWMGILLVMGSASMLVGGLLALRQDNLKWLLAYSTISMFGFIFVLTALGEGATFAVLWFVLQHAIIKAGLFFAAGAVESTPAGGMAVAEGATRTPPRFTFLMVISAVLALSLAGIPPLAGFWMKEFFLARLMEESPHPLLVATGVVAAALTLIYMLRFLWLGFSREMRNLPFGIVLVVTLLSASTLLIGIFPEPISRALVEPAAAAITGSAPDVDFGYHLAPELLLSLLALATGALLFWGRTHWQPWLAQRRMAQWSLDGFFEQAAYSILHLGRRVQRVQNGSLERYLYVVMMGLIGLILLALPGIWQQPLFEPHENLALLFDRSDILWASALLLILIGAATVLTLVVQTHLRMVLMLGVVGFITAGLFGLLSAPNLGLVQVHVETLITVLFVLLLVRVPHRIRHHFEEQSLLQDWRWSRLMIALFFGGITGLLSWIAIKHQPPTSVAAWYNEETLQLVGAEDIVAAILVHFRALDTLGEIVVFAIATLGVWILVQRIGKAPK
jgi:multicomponent Na+:H+ antiporter subunit A